MTFAHAGRDSQRCDKGDDISRIGEQVGYSNHPRRGRHQDVERAELVTEDPGTLREIGRQCREALLHVFDDGGSASFAQGWSAKSVSIVNSSTIGDSTVVTAAKAYVPGRERAFPPARARDGTR